jgi:hypothetical protein
VQGEHFEYARMRFDKDLPTKPESEIELPNRLAGHAKRGFIKLLHYNPSACGEHVLPYPSVVDQDKGI